MKKTTLLFLSLILGASIAHAADSTAVADSMHAQGVVYAKDAEVLGVYSIDFYERAYQAIPDHSGWDAVEVYYMIYESAPATVAPGRGLDPDDDYIV